MKLRLLFIALLFTSFAEAQTIGTFNSVQPTAQTQTLVIPSTHRFQRIIRTGDALTAGGTLGTNLDFTGYIPIGGSSTNGYLSISSESTPAESAVLNVSYSAVTELWSTSSSGKVTYPFASIGNISRFCSGTVTPANTVIICEEAVTAGDGNGDGYQDIGWMIEIDPATRTVINQDGAGGPDKLWAAGRQAHENCAIDAGGTIMYWGADDNPTGYVYKFVPSVVGNYSNGALFVLVTTGALGTGTWAPVANATQAQRNNTVAASTTAGAFNFNGVEDVEIGPDGKIYFAAKGPGVIYRFNDNGATVSNLEVFVSSVNYDVDGAGPFVPEPWGIGNDNLAFDGEGNLWVLQDGTRNHIWVVAPTHTPATPAVRLFATTPAGCEPTGISFSPDNKFLFMSFMHPSAGNTLAQVDAAGASVVFNTHTTVVIARQEFLGTPPALPVQFLSFKATAGANLINVEWKFSNATNHSYFAVERSIDNIHFSEIYRNNAVINTTNTYSLYFNDVNVVPGTLYYYRIKQCDRDGSCEYSETRSAKIELKDPLNIYPVPVRNEMILQYVSGAKVNLDIRITDAQGRVVLRQSELVVVGNNEVRLRLGTLPSGNYVLITKALGKETRRNFVKIRPL